MKHTLIANTFQLDDNLPKAACIGYFDGLHLGHQRLIRKTIAIAREKNIEAVLITFDPDPWTVIHGKNTINHITPNKEKLKIAETLGLDHVITIHFTRDLSNFSPEKFIERILVQLNITDLVCGKDYRFGHKGSGDVKLLQELGESHFKTHVIEIDEKNDIKIGSTAIIQAILNGNLEKANEYLGRPYSVSGFVVDGRKQGRKIGFPTANLNVVDEYVIPKSGIYAGFATVRGETYQAVLNIGTNPTFNTREERVIETHLLDFSDDIYGEIVHQSFIRRLRDEVKFASIADLVAQMHEDVKEARAILNEVAR